MAHGTLTGNDIYQLLPLLDKHSTYVVHVEFPGGDLHQSTLKTGEDDTGFDWEFCSKQYKYTIPFEICNSVRIIRHLHTF